jgi:hypothetical protein
MDVNDPDNCKLNYGPLEALSAGSRFAHTLSPDLDAWNQRPAGPKAAWNKGPLVLTQNTVAVRVSSSLMMSLSTAHVVTKCKRRRAFLTLS